MTKNAELEKSSVRRKLFKTELLQLTADELNYSLCLFVKEVRKPNGSEYAPDTIYYLVLGIQEYLYENGRIDNIFTDPYYERFTDCLDEVAKKFSVLYNDSRKWMPFVSYHIMNVLHFSWGSLCRFFVYLEYIVTRVEEEHLWECKQLGAHSPHVLLSTLMFFNTKHFNLTVSLSSFLCRLVLYVKANDITKSFGSEKWNFSNQPDTNIDFSSILETHVTWLEFLIPLQNSTKFQKSMVHCTLRLQ